MDSATGVATSGCCASKAHGHRPRPASHSNLAVPITLVPPTTVGAESVRDSSPIRRTMSCWLEYVWPPYVALFLPVCIPATGLVVIWKDSLVAPAGIVRLAGMLAEENYG